MEDVEINYKSLCQNTHDEAIEINKNNLEELDNKHLEELCYNPNKKVFEIISNNIDKLDSRCWIALCRKTNDKIVDLILSNIDKIDNISINDINYDKYDTKKEEYNKIRYEKYKSNEESHCEEFEILLKEIEKIDLTYFHILCENSHPKIVDYIIHKIVSLDRLYYEYMNNPNYNEDKKLLRNKIHKLFYDIQTRLCYNSNDKALNFLFGFFGMKYFNEICWLNLCSNKNTKVLELLEKNVDKLIHKFCSWTRKSV